MKLLTKFIFFIITKNDIFLTFLKQMDFLFQRRASTKDYYYYDKSIEDNPPPMIFEKKIVSHDYLDRDENLLGISKHGLVTEVYFDIYGIVNKRINHKTHLHPWKIFSILDAFHGKHNYRYLILDIHHKVYVIDNNLETHHLVFPDKILDMYTYRFNFGGYKGFTFLTVGGKLWIVDHLEEKLTPFPFAIESSIPELYISPVIFIKSQSLIEEALFYYRGSIKNSYSELLRLLRDPLYLKNVKIVKQTEYSDSCAQGGFFIDDHDNIWNIFDDEWNRNYWFIYEFDQLAIYVGVRVN